MIPGLRFFPTEEELLGFYLHHKLLMNVADDRFSHVIPTVHIFEHDPWHLPRMAGVACQGDTEQWFFFSPLQEAESLGGRRNRRSPSGYWKEVCRRGYVYSSCNKQIGVKKTLVFYEGNTQAGDRTQWKMNEYNLLAPQDSDSSNHPTLGIRREISLCRLYVKSGGMTRLERQPSLND